MATSEPEPRPEPARLVLPFLGVRFLVALVPFVAAGVRMRSDAGRDCRAAGGIGRGRGEVDEVSGVPGEERGVALSGRGRDGGFRDRLQIAR